MIGSVASGQNPFAEHVRTTEPLSPEEQEARFSLPEGFRITLFAAEPDIAKPMNMAFDDRGRMWLTNTLEYPYAAPEDRPARDSVKVLEDTDGDGRADRVTTFADGLNIPIGVLPYRDGALVWSIPNIWWLRDTDDDGVADHREALIGPLGDVVDTHGMQNGFRRGFDGWVYICHGFRNESRIQGRSGDEITLQSGNTYRMWPDASRVEQHTWGQVNPFGQCQDQLGYFYTADCHSSPIYQLIRGAHYPSFGKPHDGLGFAPVLMQHTHDSTALCGIVTDTPPHWPEEFHGCVYIGNVMGSRVHRDRLDWTGASPSAVEMEDLVKTEDPWFRPVDIRFGPDGAMYVADFYNRIIGHYEVPLEHPGRDRHRGRIWRISWEGDTAEGAYPPPFDLVKASLEEVVGDLSHPHLTRRLRAAHHLVDQRSGAAATAVEAAWKASQNPDLTVQTLWILQRLGRLTEAALAEAGSDASEVVRAHVMRLGGERETWGDALRERVMAGIEDASPHVARAATESAGLRPVFEQVPALLSLWERTPEEDDHLIHTVRVALREHMKNAGIMERIGAAGWEFEQRRKLAGIALAVPGEAAAGWLLQQVSEGLVETGRMEETLRHLARHLRPEAVERFAKLDWQSLAPDTGVQLNLYRAAWQGLQQRGMEPGEAFRGWGRTLAERLFAECESGGWTVEPVLGAPPSEDPWFLQRRDLAGLERRAWFVSSLTPGGERLTGVLRSPPFETPETLSFWAAGHDGLPDHPAGGKNWVRLRDVESGEVLAEAPAPRNDLAQRVDWRLEDHRGRRAYLEIADGQSGEAFAWLAVSRLEPPVVDFPERMPRDAAANLVGAFELVRELRMMDFAGQAEAVAKDEGRSVGTRSAALLAVRALAGGGGTPLEAAILPDGRQPEALRVLAAEGMAQRDSLEAKTALVEALRSASGRVRDRVAELLAGSRDGADLLYKEIQAGRAGPQLLLAGPVRERLEGSGLEQWEDRAARLTQGIPDGGAELANLAAARRASFHAASGLSTERGKEIYTLHCAVCHQIGGNGGLIGPQLDGIGHRGADRLIEDILDPNLNVDLAFRYTLLDLADGSSLSGLFRREEGELLVFADAQGQEFAVKKADVVRREQSSFSLMPPIYGQVLTEPEFHDLVAYLLRVEGESIGEPVSRDP
ncbi:MAG TPA: PVC-type heme-binding CxxCH protein [Verrucomicrobiales bacterium]|nr:PVC-type heme-binding CxxCH protein [Verrucomicrobiales bacterium]